VRYLLAILGVVVVVGGLTGVKFKQISSLIHMGEAMAKAGPPPEVVSTRPAQEQEWSGTIAAVGSISPSKGVTVANEVAGVVTAIRFESGALVKRGQVLVELDSSVERAQLASALARRQLAGVTAERSRALVRQGAIAKSQVDNDDSVLEAASADVGALQAQIDRKTVRASFAGRLGIRQINLGQYLNPGTAITVLQSVDADYVDFTLPQQRLSEVAVGQPVHVLIDGAPEPAPGAIAAIDPTVDPATRTIKLRASVADGARLRPGMFVTVEVVLPDQATRIIVPATAVVHASYGDSVFIVEDHPGPDGKTAKVARQQFVRTGETRGDFVSVVNGVSPGQEIVVAGAFKLRNGAPVVVNNEVKLDPQLAPRPENR
jgi:membrane fusion protein (multidrug efflux system)